MEVLQNRRMWPQMSALAQYSNTPSEIASGTEQK